MPKERNFYRGITEEVPDLNLDLLLEIMFQVEDDPSKFKYGWRECFAGHVCTHEGGRWVKSAGDTVYASVLAPEDGEHVKAWNYIDGQPYVPAGDRAKRLLGLTETEATSLFININPDMMDARAAYLDVVEQILQDRGIDVAVIDERRQARGAR